MVQHTELDTKGYLDPLIFSKKPRVYKSTDETEIVGGDYLSESAWRAEVLGVAQEPVLSGMLAVDHLADVYKAEDLEIPPTHQKALFAHYLVRDVVPDTSDRISRLSRSLLEPDQVELMRTIRAVEMAADEGMRLARWAYHTIIYGLSQGDKPRLIFFLRLAEELIAESSSLNSIYDTEDIDDFERRVLLTYLLHKEKLARFIDVTQDGGGGYREDAIFSEKVKALRKSGLDPDEIVIALGRSPTVVAATISSLLASRETELQGRRSVWLNRFTVQEARRHTQAIEYFKKVGLTNNQIAIQLGIPSKFVKVTVVRLIADDRLTSATEGHMLMADAEIDKLYEHVLKLRSEGLNQTEIAKQLGVRIWRVRDAVRRAIKEKRINSYKGRKGVSKRIYDGLKNADPEDRETIRALMNEADIYFCINNSRGDGALLSSFGALVSELGYKYRSNPGLFVQIVREYGYEVREAKHSKGKKTTLRFHLRKHGEEIRSLIRSDPRLQKLVRD